MVKKMSIVVIGTSAGGSMVLPELIRQFTGQMNMAVLIVVAPSKRAVW